MLKELRSAAEAHRALRDSHTPALRYTQRPARRVSHAGKFWMAYAAGLLWIALIVISSDWFRNLWR
jgi:hypothetical protein